MEAICPTVNRAATGLNRALDSAKTGSRGRLAESQRIWDTARMEAAVPLDIEAIRSACEGCGVERLRVFGSVLTDRFDPETSDVDFLVTFRPERQNLFHNHFDLRFELERIVGRGADLVVARSVRNPFFKAALLRSAQDLHAARSWGAPVGWCRGGHARPRVRPRQDRG